MKRTVFAILFFCCPLATVWAQAGKKKSLGMIEYIVNAAVKIQTVDSVVMRDGKEVPYGGYATGLFFLLESKKGKVPTIITTKTAIASAQSVTFFFLDADTAGLPVYGNLRPVTIAKNELAILFHPEAEVDLAMILINPIMDYLQKQKIKISYHNLDESLIPNDSVMNTLNVIDDLLMIGHPAGVRPELNGVPFVKKGVSATPMFLDYQNKKEFIADIPVYDGSSGAPVVLYQPLNHSNRFDQRTPTQRVLLVGINYAALSGGYRQKTIPRLTHLLNGPEQEPTEKIFDAAIIIKSQKILDFKKLLEALNKK
jgi:hypothetical protein